MIHSDAKLNNKEEDNVSPGRVLGFLCSRGPSSSGTAANRSFMEAHAASKNAKSGLQ